MAGKMAGRMVGKCGIEDGEGLELDRGRRAGGG